MSKTTQTTRFTAEDVPDLSNKVAIVTGGNRSIGLETVYMLLRKNCTVHIAGRSQSGYDEAVKTISSRKDISPAQAARLHYIKLDLSTMKGSNAAAQGFLQKRPARLDIVICNAGISMQPGYVLSEESGHELMFNTNHLGHVAFVKPLLPLMEQTARQYGEARLVITASSGYTFTDKLDFDALTKPAGSPKEGIRGIGANFQRYGVSKLANLLYMRELERRWAEPLRRSGVNVRVNCVHPGTISDTNLGGSGSGIGVPTFVLNATRQVSRVFSMTQPEGAMTQTFVATHPSIVANDLHGLYFTPDLNWRWRYIGSSPKPLTTAVSTDDEVARKLWDYTEEVLQKVLASS